VPEALAKIQALYYNSMKNLFFSLAFMLIGSFAFANTNEVKTNPNEEVKIIVEFTEVNKIDDLVSHTCYYGVYNSRGERIGSVVMTDVPNNVSCGSSLALANAVSIWNNQ
jgi:sporulation protein YlmC with PRC-barrel domain